MLEFALVAGAYLVGSIPFGVLIARARGVDLFQVGSGNVGATNVKRALGLGPALVVFALDVLKGAIPSAAGVFLLQSQEWGFGIGLAAVAGHCLSPFLKFRGGKGIATGLGALMGAAPLVAASAFAVFFVAMMVSRWVSLSSMLGAVAAVGFGILYGCSPLLIGCFAVMAAFLVYRHRPNIQRLIDGTEPKFEWGRGGSNPRRPDDGSEPPEPSDPTDRSESLDMSEDSDLPSEPEGAARV